MEVQYIGDHPKNVTQDYLDQLISLVTSGGQVKSHFVKTGIRNASSVAILIIEGKVIAGCCLKNPASSYRNGVFAAASANQSPDKYPYELGYIVTHPEYEGKGFCGRLLDQFLPAFSSLHIYATTRKPAMLYILGKQGFYKTGTTYKDDLELLLYDAKAGV